MLFRSDERQGKGDEDSRHVGLDTPSTDSSSGWTEDREKSASKTLAAADDWRNQDLSDVATNRTPLLVALAPLPPAESVIPNDASEAVADAMDDSLGIDIQEPAAIEPQSKLWMIFAAAAGAFALLFVRRRPAALPRSGGPVR